MKIENLRRYKKNYYQPTHSAISNLLPLPFLKLQVGWILHEMKTKIFKTFKSFWEIIDRDDL